MYLIGRWQRCRPWMPGQDPGPRLLIDRKWGIIQPDPCHEWWKRPDGLLVPATLAAAGLAALILSPADAIQCLIAGLAGRNTIPRLFFGSTIGGNAVTTKTLNDDYVYGTSGGAIGARFQLPVAEILNTVYYYVGALTGPPGEIDVELRNDAAGPKPGTTIHDAPAPGAPSANTWNSLAGFTFALAKATPYWMVIGDKDAGTEVSSSVITVRLQTVDNPVAVTDFSQVAAVTDGFSATPVLAAVPSSVIMSMASGRVYGNPITATALSASSTLMRGWNVSTTALLDALQIFGALGSSASGNISGGKIWVGASPDPTGAADDISTSILVNLGTASSRRGWATNAQPYTLLASTAYRIVFTFSAAATGGCHKNSIGTGTDATLRAALPGAGTATWAQESTGPAGWANDDANAFPSLALLIDDLVTPAAGGVHQMWG